MNRGAAGGLAMGISAAWEDRFTVPTAERLRKGMTKPLGDVVEAARSKLGQLDGLVEDVSWEGVAWHWTIVYHAPDRENTHAWAYLIPDPQGPKIAVPLDEDEVKRLPLSRAKKHVRDGVMSAKRVNRTWWAVWDVGSKTALEDVLDLVRRRHKLSHESN